MSHDVPGSLKVRYSHKTVIIKNNIAEIKLDTKPGRLTQV